MSDKDFCNCNYYQKKLSCLDYFIYHDVSFEYAVRFQMSKGINCYGCRFLKKFGYEINFDNGEVERVE